MKKIKMQVQTGVTFGDGCEEYLVDCASRNLRDGTIKHYRDSILQLYKYIDKDTPVSDLNEQTVSQVVIDMRDNPALNDQTMYTYLRDLKTLMYFFMRREWLEHFKITLTKADKTPIETYTDEELRLLLRKPSLKETSFTEFKAWTIVNFLLSTGMRENSLINIKIGDLDLDSGYVYVKVTKNRKPLTVPLNKDCVSVLKEYLRFRGGESDDYLFCNIYGKKLTKSTCYHTIYDYNKSRGVQTTGLHRFRHTFAKKFVLAGGSVVTLSKILGHSSLDITQNYLNILVCDLKKDVEEYNILAEFKNNRIKM